MPESEQIDPVLQTIVGIINDEQDGVPDTELHLTLMVEGATVTGILVPNVEWFEQRPMLKTYADDLHKHHAERAAVVAAVEQVKTKDGAEIDKEWVRMIYNDKETAYIHLKDARFFAGTNLVPTKGENGNNGVYWRAKLSAVSAWSFGSLNEGPSAT